MREEEGILKVYFSGRLSPDLLKEKEEMLSRSFDKLKSVGMIFEEDCEASSALVGMIMRLDRKAKESRTALRLRILSPKIMTLLKALNLAHLLKIV